MSVNQNTAEIVVHGPAQIGHAIRRYREVRGFDQAELAELADVHRSYVSKTENSTPTETLGKVMRMLRALDLELVVRPRAGS
ncbi:MAG TPA: helix-turn-helix transcriptional regulator [Ilumatobacter sp.]|nr:helix-turn-helix transcriptional regulator [Ilumatobacter sp.]